MIRIQEDKRLLKYLFILFFLVLLALAYLVIAPFLNALLASLIITYLFYPLYKYIKKGVKHETLSAFIASLLIILLISIPLIFVLQAATTEAGYFYLRAKQKIATGGLLKISCEADEGFVCDAINFVNNVIADPEAKSYIQDSLKKFTNFIVRETSDFVFTIPLIILHLFITFFTTFYLFRDGPALGDRLKNILPISKVHQKHISKRLHDVLHAIVYGSIVVALIQGTLGGIGFWIVGIPSPILWGILMSLFALIPMVGTGIIWVPASLGMAAYGYLSGDTVMVWKAIGLFIYGVFVIAGIDNVLKPKIIGERAHVHPVIILLGVLGGLKFFGIVGFAVGPLILAIFITFLEIYEYEKKRGFRDA